ncbi:MAG: endonuclease/exonuclease/phosphatase family protein [Rhodospirillales bacterium]
MTPARVRLASFNVETFGTAPPRAEGARPTELDERIALLRPQLIRLDADILCLQEVDGQRTGGARKRHLVALDRLLAETPYAGFHRLATVSRSSGQVRDKHNLVILSRWPIARGEQILHDLVEPPSWRAPALRPREGAAPVGNQADGGGTGEAEPMTWDRPLLAAEIAMPGHRRPLHVLNLHLKAPRAAWLVGGKDDASTWRTMAGWAQGFFLAAVKRAGQALEARLLVDRVFDADAEALIAVTGDFNADLQQVPVRTIRGDEEDAGNPRLAMRTLVPLERSLAVSRRFSVVHHGRPQMLDHILVSRPLLARYRGFEVHNEALGDELVTAVAVRGSPESFHAPIVAEFRWDDKELEAEARS